MGSLSDGEWGDNSFSDGSLSDGEWGDNSFSDGPLSDGERGDDSFSYGSLSDSEWGDNSFQIIIVYGSLPDTAKTVIPTKIFLNERCWS